MKRKEIISVLGDVEEFLTSCIETRKVELEGNTVEYDFEYSGKILLKQVSNLLKGMQK